MSSAIYPSLKGKRVVVTGGGSGIGAGLTAGFVRQGAEVIFLDIVDEDSKALVAQLTPNAAIAPVYRHCDLMDLEGLKATLAEIGDIDVLVNNAGNDDRHKLADITPAYWDNRIGVNLRHMLFAAQAVAPGMARRGGGAIINLSSVLGVAHEIGGGVYGGSKAFLLNFSRGLNQEGAAHNVRVQAVLPGATRTEIWDRSGGSIDNLDPSIQALAKGFIIVAAVLLQQRFGAKGASRAS